MTLSFSSYPGNAGSANRPCCTGYVIPSPQCFVPCGRNDGPCMKLCGRDYKSQPVSNRRVHRVCIPGAIDGLRKLGLSYNPKLSFPKSLAELHAKSIGSDSIDLYTERKDGIANTVVLRNFISKPYDPVSPNSIGSVRNIS